MVEQCCVGIVLWWSSDVVEQCCGGAVLCLNSAVVEQCCGGTVLWWNSALVEQCCGGTVLWWSSAVVEYCCVRAVMWSLCWSSAGPHRIGYENYQLGVEAGQGDRPAVMALKASNGQLVVSVAMLVLKRTTLVFKILDQPKIHQNEYF